MEEDPCNTSCSPNSKLCHYNHSPSFSTHSLSCAAEQKERARRSNRLQHVRGQRHKRTGTVGRRAGKRKHGVSSIPSDGRTASDMESTGIKIQSGSSMSDEDDGPRCNVGFPCSKLHIEDCNTGNTETELHVAESKPEISEPSQSPTRLKQWVTGPLLQSFKSKIASFTEIVMSPVRLFKPTMLPTPSACSDPPNPHLDSVCATQVNAHDRQCCDTTAEKIVVMENSVSICSSSVPSVHKGVERKVCTRMSDCPCCSFKSSGMDKDGKKRVAQKKLNFEVTKVKNVCQEQDVLCSYESNFSDSLLPEMDGPRDSLANEQVLASKDSNQGTESHLCVQHSPPASARFDSLPESSIEESPKSRVSSFSLSSSTKQQTKSSAQFQRPSNKCTFQQNSGTAEDVQDPTKEAAVYGNFEEQHTVRDASQPTSQEVDLSMELHPLSSSVYYTTPDTLSLSNKVIEGDLGHPGYKDNIEDGRVSTSMLQELTEDEMKREVCTAFISLSSRCSTSPAIACNDSSDQSVAEDVTLSIKQKASWLDQPQTTGWPLLGPMQKGHTMGEEKVEMCQGCVTDEGREWTDIQTVEYQRVGIGSGQGKEVKKGKAKTISTSYKVLEQNSQKPTDVGLNAEAVLPSSRNSRSDPFRRKGGVKGRKTTSVKHITEGIRFTQEHNVNCLKGSSNGDNGNVNKNIVNTGSYSHISAARHGRGKELKTASDSHSSVNNTCPSGLGSSPILDCTRLSPDCSAPVAAMVTITIEREDEMERITTSKAVNRKTGHQVPNKAHQYCRLRKRSMNPVADIDLAASCMNSHVVQKRIAPQRRGSKVAKTPPVFPDGQSSVNKDQQGTGKLKQRTRNCNGTMKVAKRKMSQRKNDNQEINGEKDLGGRVAQSGDRKKVNKDDFIEVMQQCAVTGNAKLHPKEDIEPNVLEELPSLSRSTMHLSNVLNPRVSLVDVALEKGNLLHDSALCGTAVDQVEDTPHRALVTSTKCVAHHVSSKEGSLSGKQQLSAVVSASAALQRARTDAVDTGDRAEHLTTSCSTVRKRRKLIVEKPGALETHRKRAKRFQKPEGEEEDDDERKMGEQTKEASPSTSAGRDAPPARLSRSYSCPEIPLLPLEHSLSTPVCPSFPHSRLRPSSMSQCAPVQHSCSPAKRARRHTVCSMEVERELAPLCLRKEVFPAGRPRLYCTTSGVYATSPSCTPLTVLASCFLSSPLAFLSQKQQGRGASSNSSYDVTPSYSPHTTPSHTSPASPSSSPLFPGSSPSTPLRSGESPASRSSVRSISSHVPLGEEDSSRLQKHQQGQSRSSLQLAARDTQEEKALSDSEVKMDVTKPGGHGKVSCIRIRKTLPKAPANLTPMGLPKLVRLKKKEFSVEEIYTNKNFRKPPEGRLETIFEVPVSCRDGSLALVSQRRFKRLMEFPELGVARRPKKTLVGSGAGASRKSGLGRTRRGGGPSPSLQELDLLLCSKLSQLDSWIAIDQESVLA